MDWNQILTLFDGQGLVFWGAVAAVALGLTLLSVSIVFQVRRMAGGRGAGRFGAKGRSRAGRGADRSAGITVTEDGYRADGYLPANNHPDPADDEAGPAAPENAATDVTAASEDMSERLLKRLRTAADHLDSIHSTLRPRGAGAAPGHSPLKGHLPGVDYVYKSGRA